MTRQEFHTDFQDTYEYHGNTSIELIRKQGGTVQRDWLLFDSVEEAQEFFNNTYEGFNHHHIHLN